MGLGWESKSGEGRSLVAFPSNGCVPPGCQLQQILVDLRVSCTAVAHCILC